MEFKDYYQVMGVARDATDTQIKQAYRKLARKFHPDVSKEKDAEARFKEVGEAYEVLKSPEKRAAYDQVGKNHTAGEDFRAPPNWDSGFEFSGPGPGNVRGDAAYSDFFASLFGGQPGAGRSGRGHARDGRGEDHHAKVLLDLDASLQGGTRPFTLQVPEIGADGHLVSREKLLNVQIPKGILAGQSIRLAGQGEPSYGGGTAGDLFIEIDFQPHALYSVDGRDLSLQLPVAPWEAALGATIKTPTPTGIVDLKIPAESHAGSKLRLKGRGIPASPAGDFYVVLQIALPPAGDEKAKSAYRAFAASLPFKPACPPRSLTMQNDLQVLEGDIFEEAGFLTLQELSRMCAVDERHLVGYVDEGVLSTVQITTPGWHFAGSALRRARLALRLERDLELNLAGLALALDLMEELEQLRRELGARRQR